MFSRKPFAVDDLDKLQNFIIENPFATLVVNNDQKINAIHVPFILDKNDGEKGKLFAHVSKNNIIYNNITPRDEVLVIFLGPHSYVSPSWYPSKQIAGEAVPTWNYVSVQVRGTLSFIEDKQWLYSHLNQLSDQQETRYNSDWQLGDAPHNFTERMINAIVGIEVDLHDLQGCWKVSQNKSMEDSLGVVKGLRESGATNSSDMADLVESFFKKS